MEVSAETFVGEFRADNRVHVKNSGWIYIILISRYLTITKMSDIQKSSSCPRYTSVIHEHMATAHTTILVNLYIYVLISGSTRREASSLRTLGLKHVKFGN